MTDALVTYVEAVIQAADTTTQAEDRPQHERHLAAAARIFVALNRDPTGALARRLVEGERRAYGWSFLSGKEGERVERAFATFAESLGL